MCRRSRSPYAFFPCTLKSAHKSYPYCGLPSASQELTSREDRARALLMMITINIGQVYFSQQSPWSWNAICSGQVAYLNAVNHNTSRIYFIGNFLRRNKISCHRLSYAIDYWSSSKMEVSASVFSNAKPMRAPQARFLEHEGYFGALGAFILSASEDFHI